MEKMISILNLLSAIKIHKNLIMKYSIIIVGLLTDENVPLNKNQDKRYYIIPMNVNMCTKIKGAHTCRICEYDDTIQHKQLFE